MHPSYCRAVSPSGKTTLAPVDSSSALQAMRTYGRFTQSVLWQKQAAKWCCVPGRACNPCCALCFLVSRRYRSAPGQAERCKYCNLEDSLRVCSAAPPLSLSACSNPPRGCSGGSTLTCGVPGVSESL